MTAFSSGAAERIAVACSDGENVELKGISITFSEWPQFKFIAHPTFGPHTPRTAWTLTEATTGRRIARGSTYLVATDAARRKITRQYDRFVAAVAKYRKGGDHA